MQKLWILVAALGAAVLVFGIIFVVMSSSIKSQVIDGITEEGFPTFEASDYYPYLAVTDAAVNEGDIIDTVADIDASGDAVADALHKIVPAPATAAGFQILFEPSTISPLEPTVPVDTLKLHEYGSLIAFSGVIGAAKSGLALASLVQFIGIISILTGVALIVGSLVLTKVGRINLKNR